MDVTNQKTCRFCMIWLEKTLPAIVLDWHRCFDEAQRKKKNKLTNESNARLQDAFAIAWRTPVFGDNQLDAHPYFYAGPTQFWWYKLREILEFSTSQSSIWHNSFNTGIHHWVPKWNWQFWTCDLRHHISTWLFVFSSHWGSQKKHTAAS